MKLIIFGPPGSGKGVYSSRIAEKLGLLKISTGDIFREEIKKQSELGRIVENFVKKGEFVPDEIVNEVVKQKLKQTENFILDGYPRTIKQAEFLLKLTRIDAVIQILAAKEILIEKISARRICSNPKCDGNYNLASINKTINNVHYVLPPLLPKREGVCDKCGSKLYRRDDDRPEIVEKRIEVYENESKPVVELLEREIPFVKVWMDSPLPQMVEKILKGLEEAGVLK